MEKWIEVPALDGKSYTEVCDWLDTAFRAGRVEAVKFSFNLADMIAHNVQVEPNYLDITRQATEESRDDPN